MEFREAEEILKNKGAGCGTSRTIRVPLSCPVGRQGSSLATR